MYSWKSAFWVLNIQYLYIVEKYITYLYKLQRQVENLFWHVLQQVQITYFCRQCMHKFICLSQCNVKSPKQLPNVTKKSRNKCLFMVFKGILCHIHAYTVAVYFVPEKLY